ncbi:MAG: hypothetical protein O6768_06885 [Planctomycetota bacterium]|nr:hypothetical protein [Planctomycetota bacterium]
MIRIPRSLTVLAAAVFTGCASPQAPSVPGVINETVLRPRSTEGLTRLINTTSGLEVRRWVIQDDPNRIGAALMKYWDPKAVDPARTSALRRSGLRFMRVQADQVDALLAELGLASLDVTAWHGQIYDWRRLQQYSIGSGGVEVALDGRVERYGPGWFRLMVRTWTVQMEDGLYLNLELLPQFQPPHAPRLRKLLGDRTVSGEVFASIALEVQLEAGFAYVLTGESPKVHWREHSDGSELPQENPPPDSAGSPQRDTDGSSKADQQSIAAAATIGELLFVGQTQPPTRKLLVFVPKISTPLFPRGQVATHSLSAEDGPPSAARK